MAENNLDEDNDNEQLLRHLFSDMLFRIIKEGADKYFWNEDSLRVHLLAVVLNILRLDYKKPEHEKSISDFICKHKIGTIDFLQELDEMGLHFNYVNRLNIIHSMVDDGNIEQFLNLLTDLYHAGHYAFEDKHSTDALKMYIEWYREKYNEDIDDRIKWHIVKMFCTAGNPNFRVFGRLIKRMFTNEHDMDKLVNIFKSLSTENQKDFFGDIEGSYEDMKVQANFTDEIAQQIRKLIHKNTSLNNKTGCVSTKANRKKSKKQKGDFDLLLKKHIASSPQKESGENNVSDSNSDSDSFIIDDISSESASDSYSDDYDSSENDADNGSGDNRKSKRIKR
jgi:hypothetical protein